MHARVMHDGQLNLATLTTPSDKKEEVAAAVVERLQDSPRQGQGGRSRRATITGDQGSAGADASAARRALEGHASFAGGVIDAGLDAARRRDDAAAARRRSRARAAPRSTTAPSPRTIWRSTLDADGAQLRKLVPDVKLRGKWNVDVERQRAGRQARRDACVAEPPAGRLDARRAAGDERAELRARSADGAMRARDRSGGGGRGRAARRRAARRQRRSGKGANGTIDLDELVAAGRRARRSTRTARSTLAGDVRVMPTSPSRDLSQLRALGRQRPRPAA